MTDYGRIIFVLYPGAKWTLDDVTDFSTLRWHDETIAKPALAAIQARQAEAQAIIAEENRKHAAAKKLRAEWPHEKIVEHYKAGGAKRQKLIAALNAAEI